LKLNEKESVFKTTKPHYLLLIASKSIQCG